MTQEQVGLTGWVMASVATIIASLASAVAFLFKLRENENAKNIQELKSDLQASSERSKQCEQDRAELYTKCAVLEAKMETLESKVSKIDVTGTKYSHRKETK
jgi:septal ring factor EnvC (AmiA/AmiB activator)